jgi:hypothetical protein
MDDMIQFNLQRFLKLVRWTLVHDRRYYRKHFLQVLVMGTLMMTVFGVYMGNEHHKDGYETCVFVVIFSILASTVMGAGYMFLSMDGKHDRQTLLMLPASNLEKYVMRYATWILMLPLTVAAFLIADGVQYVVNVMLGHEWVQTVTGFIAEIDYNHLFGPNPRRTLLALFMLLLWIHSMYAVGATLFRSLKHNWLLTSVVLIAGYLLLICFVKWTTLNCFWWNNHGMFSLLFLCLTVLNFWLSYWLFCRQQVKGRFVNV